jgi:16S rRNA A1518/A1519 N6-dimethyltransferase RsmA/KsgA/DIM1 with predicted DNA glycosylase/AP lyase activity
MSLYPPQTVALVESGQIEDTCAGCQERVTAEIVGQVRRNPFKPQSEIDAEVKRIRAKPAVQTSPAATTAADAPKSS